MLSVSQLQKLNDTMIGEGAPVELDFTGYNIADYNNMLAIGMLDVELNEVEAYIVVNALNHYKNTQLTDYKEEIEETLEYYKEKIKELFEDKYEQDCAVAYAKNGGGHEKSEYKKRELEYYGIENDCMKVAFKEYVSNFYPRSFGGSWTKVKTADDKSKSAAKIPIDKAQEFFEAVEKCGKFGYKPSEQLLIDLKEYTPPEKPKEEPRVLIFTGKKNQYGKLLFELNTTNYDLVQRLWDKKGSALNYVDSKTYKNKSIISSGEELDSPIIAKLFSYCEELGIDTTQAKKDIEARIEAEKEKERTKNMSNMKLVDVSKLDLPFEPYEYQLKDAQEIVSKKKALIGHDMGCGKTFMATLVGMSFEGRKLVICPETLRLNWKKELTNTHKGADIKIIYSKDSPEFGKDWTVMGYQTAAKYLDIIRDKAKHGEIKGLFVDEAHNCKAVDSYGEPKSKRAAAVMEISRNVPYTYLLTGTPLPTRNKDLYNELVMLGEIDPTIKYAFHKFGEEFCDAHRERFGWNYEGNSNSNELHAILNKYMTRRLKSEVLPNLTKQRQFIPIDTPLSRDYLTVEKHIFDPGEDETYMGLAMKGRRLLSQSKCSPAVELADTFVNAEESVVIVTCFEDTMTTLMDHFGDRACSIKGGMTDKAKQEAVDSFQSGEKKICCLNLTAGGVGITLTKAHNMIICDYDWTPSNMSQVEDRICRVGQKECCNIYYLNHEKSLIDRVFIDMITEKSKNIDQVVDAVENTMDLSGLADEAKKEGTFVRYLMKRIVAEGGHIRTPKLTRIDSEWVEKNHAEQMIIPVTVRKIEEGAFEGNRELVDITLPDSLNEIKANAFKDCTSLTEIIIPEGVKKIGASAFEGCTALAEVKIYSEETAINKTAFDNTNDIKMFCPENSKASRFAKKNGIAFETFETGNENKEKTADIEQDVPEIE